MLTAEQYQQKKALLASGGNFSPEAVEKVQRALAEYETASKLNPDLPLAPQALATQPATNDAAGDESAEANWLAKPADAAKGKVIVYEPPLALAKKELTENPQLVTALFHEQAPNPDMIARMDPSSDIYKAYADFKWRQTADAATGAGKEAYRYSKAPWLHGNGVMDTIKNFGMKLTAAGPANSQAIQSFVMGADDTGSFGLGRDVIDATTPDSEKQGAPRPNPELAAMGLEEAGGNTGGAQEAVENSPNAYEAGRWLGMLSPWSITNKLFGIATGAAAPVKAVIAGEGAGAARQAAGAIAQGAAGGAAGAVATEGVREAGRAASNQVSQGAPGTTLDESAGRALSAAPMGAMFGGAGEALGQAAGGVANWTREGSRYRGAPGRFERAGGEIKFGSGPVATEPQAGAEATGRAKDVVPQDVLARDLAPHINESESKAIREVKAQVEERNRPYYQSREGQMKLPVTNVQQTGLDLLRSKHAATGEGGMLQPINRDRSVAALRGQFNHYVAGVSTTPVPGAVEMSPEEAEAFLAPSWQRKLVKPQAAAPEAKAAPAETPKAAEEPSAADAATVPPKGKAARAAGKVEGAKNSPTADTVRMQEPPEGPGKNEYGEATRPYREAQRDDNRRAVGLGQEFGIDTGGPRLSKTLRRRGIDKVYVAPQRLTAEQQEEVIKHFQILQADPAKPEARDAKKMYQAAFLDRDQRPLNGEPGAWSRQQQENSARIAQVKGNAELAAPGGDSFQALVDYSKRRPGQLPAKEALEASAKRAGPEVADRLMQLRGLDPLAQLRDEMSFGHAGGYVPRTAWGAGTRVADQAMLRLGYPAAKALENPKSSIRGGRAGRAAQMTRDDKKAEER